MHGLAPRSAPTPFAPIWPLPSGPCRGPELKAKRAIAPHSGHIRGSSLRLEFKDGIALSGDPTTVNQAINEARDPRLTGYGLTGIVPAPIQRRINWFAGGTWGSIDRHFIFDRRRRGRRAWTTHGRAARIDQSMPTPLSSAMNRRCRSTAARPVSSIAAAFRSSGLPARF